MLDETLVLWGGEFANADGPGGDAIIIIASVWMAARIAGITTAQPMSGTLPSQDVTVHDLHATMFDSLASTTKS
jgi:hypothetical protein